MTLSLLLGLTANAQETLTLQQVKERALAHNINIRTADNSILQAREQKKEAQTLYFPQVSAVGMGFKSTTELIKGDIKVADLLPSSLAAAIPSSIASMLPSNISYGMIDKGVIAGVTAIQPVFAGGQIVNGNKLAKVGVEVSELQKRVSANTVELTAEQYYWQIISLKEKQKTLETVGEMLKNLEKDADAAVKAGVGMRNDLLEVQLKQNEVESNKLNLENGLKLTRMALAQYIGAEGDIDVSATVDAAALPAYPMIKVDHSTAVAATSEYQLLQKNVDATSLQRKMEEGKRLPTVGVGVGYNYMNMGSGIKNNIAVR